MSDDDNGAASSVAKAKPAPKGKPSPKPKTSQKAKAKPAAKGASKAKAKPVKKTGMKRNADEKKATKDPEVEAGEEDVGEGEEDEEEVVPKKKPAMKRPAAAHSVPSQKVTVYKYKYKNGKWGFKVNGKEVMGVTGLNNTSNYQSQSMDVSCMILGLLSTS